MKMDGGTPQGAALTLGILRASRGLKSNVSGLIASAFLLGAIGCSKGEETADAAQEVDTSALEPHAPALEGGEELAEEQAPESPQFGARELLPIPPKRDFVEGEGGAMIHRSEAVIVAGDMRLEIRPNSSKTEQVISVKTMTPEAFERPLPPGLIVAAGQGSPHEPMLVPVARWHVPLLYELPPRTTLEALGWNHHLNSWAILGEASVNPQGTHAVFFTMILGDVVFRVKPTRDEAMVASCGEPNFRFKEEWPSKEPNAVGLTPVEERVPRDEAFAYMADFRLHESFENVSFKNEETQGAWHRNAVRGQSYRDEDFLMDPNAEAAITILQRLVAQEWYDPYTGEASMQVRLTEAYDSMIEHSQQSTHYQGRGIDLTLTPVPAPGPASRRFWYGRLSRLSVCAGFDYVFYENNLHVHASVHPTKVATLVQDEEGTYGILLGDLWAPTRWALHSYRWTDEDMKPASIAWTGWKTLEVRPADAEAQALILSAEDRSVERRAVSDFEPRRQTQAGYQALRVVDGELFFVNALNAPKLGSGFTEAHLLPLDAVTMVPTEGFRVLDSVFRPHDRSAKAWATYWDAE